MNLRGDTVWNIRGYFYITALAFWRAWHFGTSFLILGHLSVRVDCTFVVVRYGAGWNLICRIDGTLVLIRRHSWLICKVHFLGLRNMDNWNGRMLRGLNLAFYSLLFVYDCWYLWRLVLTGRIMSVCDWWVSLVKPWSNGDLLVGSTRHWLGRVSRIPLVRIRLWSAGATTHWIFNDNASNNDTLRVFEAVI